MYFLVMLELPLVHTAASWKLSLSFFLGSHSSSLFCWGFFPLFSFCERVVDHERNVSLRKSSRLLRRKADAKLKETTARWDGERFLSVLELELGHRVAVLNPNPKHEHLSSPLGVWRRPHARAHAAGAAVSLEGRHLRGLTQISVSLPDAPST